MQTPQSDQELDEQLHELAQRSHGAVVEHLRRLIDEDALPEDSPLAGALVRLGWHLGRSGDTDGEGEAYRAAVGAPDVSEPDARCFLAEWLVDHGDADEGRALIETLRRERPTDPGVYVFLGEHFEQRGDLGAATQWFTAGMLRTMRNPRSSVRLAQLMMMARRRVRLAQGFGEDEYDRRAREMGSEFDPARTVSS